MRNVFVLALLALLRPSLCSASTITFEDLRDGDTISGHYPGVVFSNATVYTAGLSLNEFEFPPHSGSNVAVDSGGPVTITFAFPVTTVGAYFTYSTALTLLAFDSFHTQVAETHSAFTNNLALSGVPGSSPNEWIEATSASGIAQLVIAGDPNGFSFSFDDLTFGRGRRTAVPEPSTAILFGIVLVGCRLISRTRASVPTLVWITAILVPGLFA